MLDVLLLSMLALASEYATLIRAVGDTGLGEEPLTASCHVLWGLPVAVLGAVCLWLAQLMLALQQALQQHERPDVHGSDGVGSECGDAGVLVAGEMVTDGGGGTEQEVADL